MTITVNKINAIIASKGLKKIFIAKELQITRLSLANKIKNPDRFTKKEIDKLIELFRMPYEEIF